MMIKETLKSPIKAFILIFLAVTVISSCKETEQPVELSAGLSFSGNNEVPAINSTGSGVGEVTYNRDTKTISYRINWQLGNSSARVVNMHFHGANDGSATKSSPVTIPITGFPTSATGNFSGTTVALTTEQENQLLAGKWYFNIHSSDFPSGELRANIPFNQN